MITSRYSLVRPIALTVSMASMAAAASLSAQVVPAAPADTVIAIQRPRKPLPTEAQSARVTRFSFIAYGDTRGRRDGTAEQYEHSLVVDGMLRTIRSLENGPEPVQFVLQSGDAVVNGRDPKQWNVSFVSLINRITTAGGVPYFLAPGNHDVTSAAELESPGRKEGLQNYLRAVGGLIPPDGASRRLTGYPAYAFGYGNTFVIAFDSNIAEDSVQFAWVKGQLEGLDRARFTNIVVFSHHPAFSSGPHGGAIVERPTAAVRAKYMPLFRKHHVTLLLTGHEHLFEHWVERYRDAAGKTYRMDHIVSGGGGAPLYTYQGEPDTRPYIREAGADSVRLTHLVKPGMQAGDNPYHYLVVHVDGTRIWVETIGVDWGSAWQPYRSARATLADTVIR
jgi:hypothetical protein